MLTWLASLLFYLFFDSLKRASWRWHWWIDWVTAGHLWNVTLSWFIGTPHVSLISPMSDMKNVKKDMVLQWQSRGILRIFMLRWSCHWSWVNYKKWWTRLKNDSVTANLWQRVWSVGVDKVKNVSVCFPYSLFFKV